MIALRGVPKERDGEKEPTHLTEIYHRIALNAKCHGNEVSPLVGSRIIRSFF